MMPIILGFLASMLPPYKDEFQKWIKVKLPNLDVPTAFIAIKPYLGLNVQLMK